MSAEFNRNEPQSTDALLLWNTKKVAPLTVARPSAVEVPFVLLESILSEKELWYRRCMLRMQSRVNGRLGVSDRNAFSTALGSAIHPAGEHQCAAPYTVGEGPLQPN